MSALPALSRQLVDHLAPSLDDAQRFYAADYVLKELSAEGKGGTRREWFDVLAALQGAERAARVRVQDSLADALNQSVRVLERHKGRAGGWEGDMPVKMSNLPQHIQLLLNLANRADSVTLDFAHSYLEREPYSGPTADQILYNEIMAEPFSGAHWGKGYDDEVKRGWTDSESDSDYADGDSDDTLSAQEIVTPTSDRIFGAKDKARLNVEIKVREGEERLERALDALRELENGYWRVDARGGRTEHMEMVPKSVYGWNEVTTKTSALSLATSVAPEKAVCSIITALSLQRELLFALSGRSGVMLHFDRHDGVSIVNGHPHVRHLSPGALKGVLNDIARRSSQAAKIRSFVRSVLCPTTSKPSNKTQEAFAEACRVYIQSYDSWVSNLEAALSGTVSDSHPATPLALIAQLEDLYGSQLDDISRFIPVSDTPVTLLNALHATLLSTTSPSAQKFTFDLLIRSAAPQWCLLSHWLHRGMPIPSSLSAGTDEYALSLDDDEAPLDPEFFIMRDRDVSWTDEDFWECGYIIDPEHGCPSIFGNSGEAILEAGKARGLLNGLVGDVDNVDECKYLAEIVGDYSGDIPSAVASFLEPLCMISTVQLRRVLGEECGLEAHLDALEGVMYMAAHDAMNEWSHWLFTQVQSGKRWMDRQTLTTGLRDAIDRTSSYWLDPSAYRLFLASTRAWNGTQTRRVENVQGQQIIEVLGSLRATYSVPFPLSVLFTPTSIDLRSRVFGFLTMVEYANRCLGRNVLAWRIEAETGHDGWEIWKVRHRLGWFVRTLWTWVTERVVQVEAAKYRSSLSEKTSLKDMIELELEHTRRMRDFCFLHDNEGELYGHLVALFGIAVEVSDRCKDRTTAASDGPSCRSRRRKSRDSDDEEEEELNADGEDEAPGNHEPVVRRDSETIAKDLEERIGEIARGVQVLCTQGGMSDEDVDRRATWSMLHFALDDWRAVAA